MRIMLDLAEHNQGKHIPLKDISARQNVTVKYLYQIKGSEETAQKCINHLKLFPLLANVTDVKSLVIHSASTTHAQMNKQALAACGIAPATIRLSIGIEHIDDIINDLEPAFQSI